MARYHVNPKTGAAGLCRATKSCPFGGAEAHFSTAEEARASYEVRMAQVTTPAQGRRRVQLPGPKKMPSAVFAETTQVVAASELAQGARIIANGRALTVDTVAKGYKYVTVTGEHPTSTKGYFRKRYELDQAVHLRAEVETEESKHARSLVAAENAAEEKLRTFTPTRPQAMEKITSDVAAGVPVKSEALSALMQAEGTDEVMRDYKETVTRLVGEKEAGEHPYTLAEAVLQSRYQEELFDSLRKTNAAGATEAQTILDRAKFAARVKFIEEGLAGVETHPAPSEVSADQGVLF